MLGFGRQKRRLRRFKDFESFERFTFRCIKKSPFI